MIRQYEAKTTDFTQADYAKQYSLLECAIRDKIDKKQELNKMQSLAGYILLYRAVKELYNKSQIKITFNEYGKPLCDACFFNISHSDERVVCAIGDEPLGIDIQQVKTIQQRNKYKYFNDKENDYVNQDKNFVSKRFIEIFTKKEAALKMLGLSLSHAATIDTFSNQFCFEMRENDGFLVTICRKNMPIM